ncbi:MAG: hypothetical protein Q6373_012535 [Candidatus Sigynarchaeota archaeon]
MERHDPPLGAANEIIAMRGKRLSRQGEAHVLWIPKQYIKDGILDPECEYDVYFVKRAKNEKQDR